MRVALLTDRWAIERIFADPWIARKLEGAGLGTDFIDHPLISYYGAYVDQRLVGVFTHAQITAIEVEVHAALLEEATRHGRTLGALFLDKVFADPKVMRATGNIIGSLTSAVNYCHKLGFKIEGKRRDAVIQDGMLLPIIILGLLREEWFRKRGEFASG